MKRGDLILLLMVAACFGAAIIIYPSVPEKMASHWDIRGNVNGYMPKAVGLFISPVIMFIMSLVFIAIPKIAPSKENINKFIESYYWFAILIMFFLIAVFVYVVLWNTGVKVKINIFLAPAFSALVFFMGVLLGNTKRNYFIGIRTAWTLSSDEAWDKTHRFAGLLMKIFSPLCLAGVFFEKGAFFILLIAIILPLIIASIYSYSIWKDWPKQNN